MASRIPRLHTGRAGALALALPFVLDLAACQPAETGAAPVLRVPMDSTDLGRAMLGIDSADIHARIAFLASDLLRGRATPSPGLNVAAEYIASEFATLGLTPGGDDGSFLQWYRLEGGSERAPNVIGILRGSDATLRDTYVVFSAHMDHVGVGQPDARGDSIYNGADDDASGTAAVMEIAEAFASLPVAPARSAVFLTVSGEENGLFGSRAFVESGPIRRERIIANINIDMIGRNARDTLVAIGLGYSTLGRLTLETAKAYPELGLTVVDDPWPAERFFFRSDHYNFARAGVPALFFFSGVHDDYHQPSDEAMKIDAEKASRIAQLAFRLGHTLLQSADAPAWTVAGRAAVQAAR
jgi:hypothetical protein